MDAYRIAPPLFAVLMLAVCLPTFAAGSTGSIGFLGAVVSPASAWQSVTHVPASRVDLATYVVTSRSLGASRQSSSIELLDYFAEYAKPGATVVTASYN
ncbi:hypothetical protein [Dyella subtropica]|uniref:hypothetical protein n=1 Tax=Dyella subtropica TaxID=2992127 RepID=UPI00224D6F49|nr:hypothetical protein [Dyella subtropica]